jgi:hypothetical protein
VDKKSVSTKTIYNEEMEMLKSYPSPKEKRKRKKK